MNNIRIVKVSFGGDKVYVYLVPDRIKDNDYNVGDYVVCNCNYGINKSLGVIREKFSISNELKRKTETQIGINFNEFMCVVPYNSVNPIGG